MKRIKILALGFILAMSLGITAWAAEGSQDITNLEAGEQTVNIGVTGSYQAGGTTKEVYSVDVSWGGMNFTYSEGSSQTWDPATHTYTVIGEEGGWAAAGDTVTVTNHSSLPVNVEFAFTKEAGMDAESTYTGSFDQTGATRLERATEGSTQDAAPSVTAKLSFTGKLSSQHGTDTQLGEITIKLSQVS